MRFALPAPVSEALDRLTAAGYEAYLVGGCVRDDALGAPPHDYDIASSATPEEAHGVFRGYRLIDTGIRHGTVTVLIAGEPIEITTFRRDGAYTDGRRPDSVAFSRALGDDLSRRDFTVNAMAWGQTDGLVDPFGGQKDLRDRLIRCVGDPRERFAEDALRILRAVRFASKLGFTIEKETRDAMLALKGRLSLVSRERVFAEMTGILMGQYAARAMEDERDILFAALPTLDAAPWARALAMTPRAPLDESARWAALLAPYGEKSAGEAARDLKMSGALSSRVVTAARWLDRPLAAETVQYAMTMIDGEALSFLLDLKLADGADARAVEALQAEMRRVADGNECVSLAQLAVRGGDLKKLGYAGAAIGDTLNALLREVALRRLPNERDALLRAAASMRAGNKGD